MAQHANAQDTDLMQVDVATIGGEVKKVALNSGATVADALSAAGYPASSEVRCKGEVFSATDVVEDGDFLTVMAGEKIKGGNL